MKALKDRKDRSSPRYRATYSAWRNMLARCYNEKHVGYPSYGGRGITVHASWLPNVVGAKVAFANFLSFMGLRPSDNHSLDRKDADKNYAPGNVRWATSIEQGVNKRGTKYVLHPKTGVRIPAADLAREMGLTYQQLRHRMLTSGTWNKAELVREDLIAKSELGSGGGQPDDILGTCIEHGGEE